jgi:DNA-binding beta-propeller fold protein YncE
VEPEKTKRRLLPGLIAVVVGSLLVACSPGSAPTSRTADVPLPAGKQSTLPVDAMGFTAMSIDAKGVLYLGGGLGISTLAPGATQPTPLKLGGHPAVSTLAAAPDGTLYFVTLDGVVETVAPGAVTPEPLPFDKLQRYGQIAVARDGAVYLGDDQRDKLLKLSPGAVAPTDLSVAGVDGPGHMVVDADDNLFVSMRGKVVKIAKDATDAETVAGATEHAGGLAVDAAGNLYATDVKAGTVARLPAAGGDWTPLPFSGLQNPTDISVDDDGNVYVLNQGRQVIRLAAK